MYRRDLICPLLLSCQLLLLTVSSAKADFAIVDFGPNQINNVATDNRTVGWIFETTQTVTISQLGIWDFQMDGLLADHQVGIFDASGNLLVETTVQAGMASPLDGPVIGGGQWRYEDISPLMLAAGTYTIGALYNNNDVFESDAEFVTTSPALIFGEERFNSEGDGFGFPTQSVGRIGVFGPNFNFTGIPEPNMSAIAVLFCSVVFRRRRQRS